MATPSQAVFDPTAPYQSAAPKSAPQTTPQPGTSSPTAPSGPQSKPSFDPNASYEPAPLPGVSEAKMPSTQAPIAPAWEPSAGDPLVRIQTSDGKNWEVHAHDLEKAKQRDPKLKVFQSYVHTPEEDARSRTLQNMTSAMAGQPMQNPEDQIEAEKGRKAGTIAGGVQIATGALGGAAGALFAPGVEVAQETSSILGPEGQPIVREVLKNGPSVAAKTASTVVETAQTIAKWTKDNPIKAVAVEALAREMGVDPFQMLGKVIKFGKHLFE